MPIIKSCFFLFFSPLHIWNLGLFYFEVNSQVTQVLRIRVKVTRIGEAIWFQATHPHNSSRLFPGVANGGIRDLFADVAHPRVAVYTQGVVPAKQVLSREFISGWAVSLVALVAFLQPRYYQWRRLKHFMIPPNLYFLFYFLFCWCHHSTYASQRADPCPQYKPQSLQFQLKVGVSWYERTPMAAESKCKLTKEATIFNLSRWNIASYMFLWDRLKTSLNMWYFISLFMWHNMTYHQLLPVLLLNRNWWMERQIQGADQPISVCLNNQGFTHWWIHCFRVRTTDQQPLTIQRDGVVAEK